jgi:hypothetical protein
MTRPSPRAGLPRHPQETRQAVHGRHIGPHGQGLPVHAPPAGTDRQEAPTPTPGLRPGRERREGCSFLHASASGSERRARPGTQGPVSRTSGRRRSGAWLARRRHRRRGAKPCRTTACKPRCERPANACLPPDRAWVHGPSAVSLERATAQSRRAGANRRHCSCIVRDASQGYCSACATSSAMSRDAVASPPCTAPSPSPTMTAQ